MKCNGYNNDYIEQTKLNLRNRLTVYQHQILVPNTRQIVLHEHLNLWASSESPKFLVSSIYHALIKQRSNTNKKKVY